MRQGNVEYRRFTQEEIEKANNVDLVSLAESYGFQTEKSGKDAIHLKKSGGLYIFPKQNCYYMKGTKLIIIDPESEYKDLCHNLNGDWINAGGGSNGMLNPLQIRPAPRDDENETEKLYVDEGNGIF